MPLLDSVCRQYQTFFYHGHPEECRLVELHSSGQMDRFLKEYFDHEYQKGNTVVERFSKLASSWKGGRALDFGCGAGGLTYQIAKSCREAVGIDLEQPKLDFALAQKNRLGVKNVQFVCISSA